MELSFQESADGLWSVEATGVKTGRNIFDSFLTFSLSLTGADDAFSFDIGSGFFAPVIDRSRKVLAEAFSLFEGFG